jgi:squalene cyclase
MRPYPLASKLDEDHFDDVIYAITHVVYTLDDYEYYSLTPQSLPQEHDYLKRNLRRAMLKYEDGEILGEFLDTLRAFGHDESEPDMRAAVEYLLKHQNSDGSWGDPEEEDIYTRYHATWTAIDGLREYDFHGERTEFPGDIMNTGSRQKAYR